MAEENEGQGNENRRVEALRSKWRKNFGCEPEKYLCGLPIRDVVDAEDEEENLVETRAPAASLNPDHDQHPKFQGDGLPIRDVDAEDEKKNLVERKALRDVSPAKRYKLNHDLYPKFQGGKLKSEMLDFWDDINLKKLLQGENFDIMQRDYFSTEYNFNFNVQLSKEGDYSVVTLRFFREEYENIEDMETDIKNPETKETDDKNPEPKKTDDTNPEPKETDDKNPEPKKVKDKNPKDKETKDNETKSKNPKAQKPDDKKLDGKKIEVEKIKGENRKAIKNEDAKSEGATEAGGKTEAKTSKARRIRHKKPKKPDVMECLPGFENIVICKPLVPAIYVVLKVEHHPHLIRTLQCVYDEFYEFDVDYEFQIPCPRLDFSPHSQPDDSPKKKGKTILERILEGDKNKMVMEIYVESQWMSTQVYSNDGNLAWAVTHYRRIKNNQLADFSEGQLSPYFYTDPRGYRVQVEVILSDDNIARANRIKNVCFKIKFLNGKYDAWLTDFYVHRTTVSVVKKSKPEEKIWKSADTNLEVGSYYFIDMGSFEEVEKFIERDRLCYTVEIIGLSTARTIKNKAGKGAK